MRTNFIITAPKHHQGWLSFEHIMLFYSEVSLLNLRCVRFFRGLVFPVVGYAQETVQETLARSRYWGETLAGLCV